MTHVTYEIVQHDGGWAYRLGDVFSETFPSHDAALAAAKVAADRQHQEGEREDIEYQDGAGRWHTEVAPGDDRPEVDVEG